jgi:serine/threonine protein kinase
MTAAARGGVAHWLGRTIGDKYRIERLIAVGGMGYVYQATNTWTERRVAIKLLEQALDPSSGRERRFLREARSASRIAHPNVIDILDMGSDRATGALFIVQELLRGRDLAAELARRESSRLSPNDCVVWLVSIAEALRATHARGIVHRDVAPANVFLAKHRGVIVPKLIDFGVATHVDTRTSGSVAGTVPYIAPEHARSRIIDPRIDVWSLGTVFYRALTGVLPYEAKDAATLLRMIEGDNLVPVDERAEVPTALATIVHRALDPDPDRRFPTMDAFVEALRRIEARDVRPPATSSIARTPRLASLSEVPVRSSVRRLSASS